jgi:hypothetical protein
MTNYERGPVPIKPVLPNKNRVSEQAVPREDRDLERRRNRIRADSQIDKTNAALDVIEIISQDKNAAVKTEALGRKWGFTGGYNRPEFFKMLQYQNPSFQYDIENLIETQAPDSLKKYRKYKEGEISLSSGKRFALINDFSDSKTAFEESFDRLHEVSGFANDRNLPDFSEELVESLAEVYEQVGFIESRVDVLIEIADYMIDRRSDVARAERYFTNAANCQLEDGFTVESNPQDFFSESVNKIKDLTTLIVALSQLITVNTIKSSYLKSYRLTTTLNYILGLSNKLELLNYFSNGNKLSFYTYMLLMGEICLNIGYYKYRIYRDEEAMEYYRRALNYFQAIDHTEYILKAQDMIAQLENHPHNT